MVDLCIQSSEKCVRHGIWNGKQGNTGNMRETLTCGRVRKRPSTLPKGQQKLTKFSDLVEEYLSYLSPAVFRASRTYVVAQKSLIYFQTHPKITKPLPAYIWLYLIARYIYYGLQAGAPEGACHDSV